MMRNLISFVFVVAFLTVALIGCDAFTSDDESGVVTFTGTIINSLTQEGVEGVLVQISVGDSLAETNAQGTFTLEVEVDSTIDATLTFTRSGFLARTIDDVAIPNRTRDLGIITMAPEEDTSDPTDPGLRNSGRASNILLSSQSSTSIGVKESGSQEVVELVFQAADSLGRPITLENQISVNFSFGVNPGGGEFIEPQTALTDASGLVRTNISSGITAGPIQVVARATVDGEVIQSKPVALVIHGGFPDEDHFGVASSVLNVARAWDFWGVEASVTAFVGDEFFNPVRPGTAVSFTSSAGIIGGSATTGPDGRASVNIISGPPQPVHPEYGNGYVTITASTADKTENEITSETRVLFSGAARIVYPAGQGEIVTGRAYEFNVYDVNQNPLAAGTNITVTAEGTNIEAFGNTNVVLTDILDGDHSEVDLGQGTTYGRTRFVFGVNQGQQTDDNGNLIPANVEAVTIRVTSPNGNIELVIVQNGTPFERSPSGELVPVWD